jgi:hypothetical protein
LPATFDSTFVRAKQSFEFLRRSESEAIAVKSIGPTSGRLREDLDVIRQCFDAAKSQTLITDPLPNLLGTDREISDTFNVLRSEPCAAIGDVKHAICLRLNYKAYRDSTVFAGMMRVMGILDQLVKNPVSVLSANDLIQIVQAFVDLQPTSLGINGVFQLRAD